MFYRFMFILLLATLLPLAAQSHEGDHDHEQDHQKEYIATPTHKVIQLPEEILSDFVGVYYWAPHRTTIAVTLEEGKLYGQPKTKPKSQLMPMENDVFFIEGVGAEVSFVRGEDGKVTSMMLMEDGGLEEAIRLKEDELTDEDKKGAEENKQKQ